ADVRRVLAAEACHVNVDWDEIVAGGGGRANAAKGHRPGELQGPPAYLGWAYRAVDRRVDGKGARIYVDYASGQRARAVYKCERAGAIKAVAVRDQVQAVNVDRCSDIDRARAGPIEDRAVAVRVIPDAGIPIRIGQIPQGSVGCVVPGDVGRAKRSDNNEEK